MNSGPEGNVANLVHPHFTKTILIFIGQQLQDIQQKEASKKQEAHNLQKEAFSSLAALLS
jgi:hypothetical protein